MALRPRVSLVRVRTHIKKAVRFYRTKHRICVTRQAQYVRRVAMNSIKRARKNSGRSRPGSPPLSHTGALKNWIRYAWDPASRTAVVGPVRLKHFRAPRALEHGGVSKWIKRTRGFWASGYQRVRARPFMRPALVRALPRMRAIARDVYSA